MPRGATLGREFWRKHIVAYESSGQSQPAYYALHGLNAKTFARWRTVFRRNSTDTPQPPLNPGRGKLEKPGFVRVQVDDEVAQRDECEFGLKDDLSGVSILRGDLRIDVVRGLDRATTAAVLIVMRAT